MHPLADARRYRTGRQNSQLGCGFLHDWGGVSRRRMRVLRSRVRGFHLFCRRPELLVNQKLLPLAALLAFAFAQPNIAAAVDGVSDGEIQIAMLNVQSGPPSGLAKHMPSGPQPAA